MKKTPILMHVALRTRVYLLRGTTLFHFCKTETSDRYGNIMYFLYPGAIMGAPIAAYADSAVGARLQDHLPSSSTHFFSPTKALFAASENVLFFSLPFLFLFMLLSIVLFPCLVKDFFRKI